MTFLVPSHTNKSALPKLSPKHLVIISVSFFKGLFIPFYTYALQFSDKKFTQVSDTSIPWVLVFVTFGIARTLARSKCKTSMKYLGRQIRIVYMPQSAVKFAVMMAHTGPEVKIDFHGTCPFWNTKKMIAGLSLVQVCLNLIMLCFPLYSLHLLQR